MDSTYVNNNNINYLHGFGVEHITKVIKKFMANKNIITNIYRIQAYDSIMCGYFCIGFIDFMLKVCLSIQIYFDKNDKVILKQCRYLKR